MMCLSCCVRGTEGVRKSEKRPCVQRAFCELVPFTRQGPSPALSATELATSMELAAWYRFQVRQQGNLPNLQTSHAPAAVISAKMGHWLRLFSPVVP